MRVIILLFTVLLGSALSRTNMTVSSLDTLSAIMLKNNPGLISFQYQVKAAKEKVPQISSLPDPQLTLGIVNLPVSDYDFNREPMTQKTIGLSQKIPLGGKLRLSENIAEKNYEVRQHQYSGLELTQLNQLENLFYDLYEIQYSIMILEENKKLLSDLVIIAQTKYSSGQGIQQDVGQSQLESLKTERILVELKSKKDVILSKIRILLGGPKLSFPIEPELEDFKNMNFSLDSLLELSVHNNPELKALSSSIERSNFEYNYARREYWPDPVISVNYGQRNERTDFISGVVALNIPLYFGSKQSKKVQEAALLNKTAEYSYLDLINKLEQQIRITLSELRSATELKSLYEQQILPQAKQSLESSVSAYSNNKINFNTLLTAHLNLQNYKLENLKIVTAYYRSISGLALICGVRRGQLIQSFEIKPGVIHDKSN